MLLGVTLATLGLQCIYLGILAQVFFDYSGRHPALVRALPVHAHGCSAARSCSCSASCWAGLLLAAYIKNGLLLAPDMAVSHLAVTGLLFMIAGFMTFTFTLLLHSTALVVWRRP